VVEQLVDQIESRFVELSEQMSDPEVSGDRERYAEVGRAYRSLEPAHQLAVEYRRAADDAAGARELLSEDGDDPELRELLSSSEARMGELEDEIRRNGWLTVKAGIDLIFDVPPEARYEAAMRVLGVNAANLSEEAGHA